MKKGVKALGVVVVLVSTWCGVLILTLGTAITPLPQMYSTSNENVNFSGIAKVELIKGR